MKTLIYSLIALCLSVNIFAQVPPPPPEPPATQAPPAPPAPPVQVDVDHDGNYKITLSSKDSDSGESIYLMLKNKEDRYLASGNFPNRFRSDIFTYIKDAMGAKPKISKSGFDQWVGGQEDDAVYKITLKENSIIISVDKDIASRSLAHKIGDLGIGIKSILSEEDEDAEVERLERDADRLRRDADRMQREAERIRSQAQRDLDRAERNVARAERDADRLRAQAERDAARIYREAEMLSREADRAGILTAHKGGMDSIVREVLGKPNTAYDATQAQNRNGWTWPAFQQDLMLSLEGDELVGEDNEFVFISDASGIYVNGNKMTKSLEDAYRDLFKRHGFDKSDYFTFYKLYNHIAVTNDNVDLEGFFKALEKRGDIKSINKPVVFEINGDSVKKDGELWSESKLKAFNLLLSEYNIIPVPGKVIEIEKKGNYLVGYRPNKNSIMGTWVMNN